MECRVGVDIRATEFLLRSVIIWPRERWIQWNSLWSTVLRTIQSGRHINVFALYRNRLRTRAIKKPSPLFFPAFSRCKIKIPEFQRLKKCVSWGCVVSIRQNFSFHHCVEFTEGVADSSKIPEELWHSNERRPPARCIRTRAEHPEC